MAYSREVEYKMKGDVQQKSQCTAGKVVYGGKVINSSIGYNTNGSTWQVRWCTEGKMMYSMKVKRTNGGVQQESQCTARMIVHWRKGDVQHENEK